MAFSGNRGEWSELYVLFKLMADGRVYGADKDLNKIDDIYYDIIKAIRRQTDENWQYVRNGSIKVIAESSGEEIISIPVDEFVEKSNLLLNKILNHTSRTGAFVIPEIDDFAESIKCNTLKAKSIDKADILLKVHDAQTGAEPTLGFSIKSRLGRPSTLINPGKTTNFIYKIIGEFNDAKMDVFNNMFTDKGEVSFNQRFDYLIESQNDLEFINTEKARFKNNLTLIDADLIKICAEMLYEFYINHTSNIGDVLNIIKERNFMNYDFSDNHPYYRYKFKKLITESALGMKPNSVWSGRADATGGYIIVKEDGDVLCYHLYNRNDFEDYLIENTCFDKASARRYGHGIIYKEGNEYFVKLNMQIRFVK